MKISIKDNTKPVSKSLKINFNKLKEDKIDLDIIKIEYAGLFAKVISKLAKKGKTYQGEVTLLKALKKADLEIKLHQSNLLLDKNKSVNITEIKKK